MQKPTILVAVSLALVGSACNGPATTATPLPPASATPVPVEASATPAPAASDTPAPVAEFRVALLRNLTYPSEFAPGGAVTLVDGQRPRDPANAADADFRIGLLSAGGEAIALGDLDGDGDEDGAVVVVADPDGTGVFYTLYLVLNEGNLPPRVAAQAFFGDRVVLDGFAIESGEAALNLLTQGPDDGACCPSQPASRRYRLEPDEALTVSIDQNGVRYSMPADWVGEPLQIEVLGAPRDPSTPVWADDIQACFGVEWPGFARGLGVPEDAVFRAQIRVYPVQNFAYYNAEADRAQLQALIDSFGQPLDAYTGLFDSEPLSFLPVVNAAQVFRAQPAYLTFGGERGGSEGGRGVRYLTHYAQGLVPLTQREVWYTFQGLTENGSYYVSVILPVRIGDLPVDAPDDFNMDDFEAYLAETFATINTTTDIQPSLEALDRLVNSIAVTREALPAQAITIDSPTAGQAFTSGSTFTGGAELWPFEATLSYRLVDDFTGEILAEAPFMTVGDIPGPVTFSQSVNYTLSQPDRDPTAFYGRLEVFEYSAKDGSVRGAASVDVVLAP